MSLGNTFEYDTDKKLKKATYNGYTIKPKRDHGRHVPKDGPGWIISPEDDPIINAAPAAQWFTSVEQAQNAIDILILVDGDASKYHSFFEILLRMQGKRESKEQLTY